MNAAAPLGRLRFDAAQGRGRRYPELPHPYRTDFQRDRDRVIHSRAFRRLEDKTQVFASGLSDHFRNRLTHTIEVAQISRTAASALGLDEDFMEALALAHDIGHPPFAHSGEEELNALMAPFGETFEHNRHALRIVETFESRYARFPGLNLTFELREGIVKHSSELIPGESPELDEYLPHLRPPVEAQLIDLCDEVAYNTADLDDGYAAGFVTHTDAAAAVPQFATLWETAEMQFPGADDKLRMQEVVRGLVDHLVTGLLQGTVAAAAKAAVQTSDDVRQLPNRIAMFDAESFATDIALKEFLRTRVYESDMLARERDYSRQKVARLFGHFLSFPDTLPSGYRQRALDEPLHRVVCDYIAGMTDGYLNRTYADIFS